MFDRRFIPYTVGIIIVALVSVSYVGYRAYQNHVAFKAFMSNAQAFNRSAELPHNHSSHDHTDHSAEEKVASHPDSTGAKRQPNSSDKHPYQIGRTPSGDYAYNIAGHRYTSKEPMSQRAIEIEEWVLTGKMTTGVEETMQMAEMLREMSDAEVIQTVVTPDGQLHHVIVPRYAQYEEGDAILQSELDPPDIEWAALSQKPWLNNRVEIDGVWHDPPEEYYSIEEPYEREAYMNKFTWSIQHSISMAEVEKKIAQGELPQPLSESDKRIIDEDQIILTRRMMLSPGAPTLSNNPPVKVSFLPDDREDALPGWRRKRLPKEIEKGDKGNTSVDTNPPTGQNNALSPKALPGMVDPKPLSPSEQGLEESKTPNLPKNIKDLQKQFTQEGFEAELSEGLESDPVNKAQQLIDQFGSEEGLRRLREIDLETARRFESDKSRLGQERRNPPARDTSDDASSTQ